MIQLGDKNNFSRMYLGEYPLSYAASLDLMDCYKLLRTNKADPNLKDTNGNTALHMTVIHERLVKTTPSRLTKGEGGYPPPPPPTSS